MKKFNILTAVVASMSVLALSADEKNEVNATMVEDCQPADETPAEPKEETQSDAFDAETHDEVSVETNEAE